MPRGRRRKIEVPTDTQPQFGLGYTAKDIERRRRERDERERTEIEERDRERAEGETTEVIEEAEETEDRRKKRPRIDTECMQSKQKKGQMKSIFLRDSDEDDIMDFVKQHDEFFDKTHTKFKDKQRKERLWDTVELSRNLPSQAKLQQKTPRDRPG